MMINVSEVIEGQTLLDAYESGDLDVVISELDCAGVQGVYVWLRRISPRNKDIGVSNNFLAWLSNAVERPQGFIEDALKHVGRIRFQLGGAHLTKSNRDAMENLAGNYDFLKGLQNSLRYFDYTQALYVGESDDLGRRIGEHISGKTDFSRRLKSLGYDWEDLGVRLLMLPDSITKDQLRALERTLAIMLLAPATSRAG